MGLRRTALISALAAIGFTAPRATPTPRIAFASDRDGNWEIYLTDVDGEHQTRLTRRDAQDRFPLWSPDRSQIAFGSQVGGDHWELWMMNADGSNPHPLATQIVAKGFRQWSHDGTRIVFTAKVDSDVEIFSVEVTSGRLTRLTNSPGEDADPSWSPDDSRIAFLSMRNGDRDVHLLGVDGERSERLTTGAHATNDALRWSPNGAYVAVQTAERDNYDIQLVRLSDHERRSVASSAAFDGQYSWSPASDQLTFISGRDGFDAVYVTNLVGKQSRLTVTPSLNPEWSP